MEEIAKYGKPFQFGLEAGSKPELLIALATLRTPGSLLICNGYKDAEYIETALLARKLGQNTIIVIEQLEDTPFYQRAVLASGLFGQRVISVHETLNVPRLVSPIVQKMLPFRMPRLR